MPTSSFDVASQRQHFPILQTLTKGNPLVYLDNAASTQKPDVVIEAIREFYLYQYSNVHRGIYTLSEKASELFEQTRGKIQRFIGADSADEIVLTHGTTESINLVAQSYLRPRLKPNDEIIISQAEHHANIVPWQQLCEQTGACLKVIPLNSDGSLHVSELDTLLNNRTRLVAVTHLSNVLGTFTPLRAVIEKAHDYGVPVLVDGAQAIAHLPVHVQQLNCDFYAFSSHKMYGPGGIGVLYAKKELLESMPPWQSGGGMIQRVTFEKTEYCKPPHRFEAGTPAIAEAIGLGVAIDYLQSLDWNALMQYETNLFQYASESLQMIPALKLLSATCSDRGAVLSFSMDRIHAHDIATILNEEGIAVRAGHHCAMPLMEFLKVSATVRVSLGFYNTDYEIDALIKGLRKVQALLA